MIVLVTYGRTNVKIFSGCSKARADNRKRTLSQSRPQRYHGTKLVGNNVKTPNGKVNFLSMRTVPNGALLIACEYVYKLLRLCVKFGYICSMIMGLEILGDAGNFTTICKFFRKFPDFFSFFFFFEERKRKLRKTWN